MNHNFLMLFNLISTLKHQKMYPNLTLSQTIKAKKINNTILEVDLIFSFFILFLVQTYTFSSINYVVA